MGNIQNDSNENREEQAIVDTLESDPVSPGNSEVDGLFLMHLDIPDDIRQKMKPH
ncbi:hypothetical protein [Planctobacterium marinum]|uniref:hypothetical protein n=1 Tax=Planctobacterium marinum TaxID=1631968 RepID=UPI001E296CE9|nr:hypothetical protein [Planctobacterium marinum]MCC2606734.1 hypothetical protein [Planctobacterium marinum]